jgi:hypothetical protein
MRMTPKYDSSYHIRVNPGTRNVLSRVCERFLRYRELEPESRKLFWRALALLPIVKILLRFRGFKRTRNYLEGDRSRQCRLHGNSSAAHNLIQRTTRMVRAASELGIIRANCLQHSLMLWHLLQKQGIQTNLRIGVRTSAGAFEAHAWVEYAGVVLNDTEDVHQRFAAFETDFSRGPWGKS